MNLIVKERDDTIASEDAQCLSFASYEKCLKSSLYGTFGVVLIISLCFVAMSLVAILLLSQLPETEWILKSLVSSI
jgi:hypothetical protein